ncbi:MAG: hypothetical protein OXC69_01325 [Candidatus Tectomicrobia bacterium]|nr:hypothetical protein [Candidatus Tectomicrobia bacterium]
MRRSTAGHEIRHTTAFEFYLKRPDLLGQVPIAFGEQTALARLLAYCGVFEDKAVGLLPPEDMFYLV